MESLNQQVIEQVAEWLAAGQCCWLATVVRTHGSSPRPVGSLMAFQAQRGAVGSLSGGCVEADLWSNLAKTPQDEVAKPRLLRYGLTDLERQRYGLPCGGELHVLLEDLRPQPDVHEHFQSLRLGLRQRRPLTRELNQKTGQLQLRETLGQSFSFDSRLLCHPLYPRYRLLLVGAGEVARALAQFAPALDFQVTLCEPREEFLQPMQDFAEWRCDVLRRLPDDLIREQFHDPQTAILALAHDPRVDDMALLEALSGPAFYVGAMGSQATSADRRLRLRSLGVEESALARLHAPIGLGIGSKTPAEIAIAILADLIASRRQRESQFVQISAENMTASSRSGCLLGSAPAATTNSEPMNIGANRHE